MKRVEIKLIVDVDVTDELICPSGDHLEENCVLNAVNNDFFMNNVANEPFVMLSMNHPKYRDNAEFVLQPN